MLGRGVELTSSLLYDASSDWNGTQSNQRFTSHIFLPIPTFPRPSVFPPGDVIHTLRRLSLFSLSFPEQKCTHANTAFKSNTNLADITNHERAARHSLSPSVRSFTPSVGRLDRDETEDTNGRTARSARADGRRGGGGGEGNHRG